jgi:hypothetical protein
MVPQHEIDSIRELLVGAYRIVYVYNSDDDVARIAAILHGSRSFPDIGELLDR